jgi:hypothetical protein
MTRALLLAVVIAASVWLATGATASAHVPHPYQVSNGAAARTTGQSDTMRMPSRHLLEIVAVGGVLLSGAGAVAMSRVRRR